MPAHVRRDEPGPRMPREQAVALGHHRVEARVAVGRQAPVRQQRQLEPAFVEAVDRLVERQRLADVEQHRDVEPRAQLEDGVQLRMVDRQAPAALVAHAEPEVLEELQADRPGRHVLLELRGGARAEARADAAAEVEVGEEDHAVRMRAAGDGVEAAPQQAPPSPAQVDQHLQVQRVHLRHDPRPARRRESRAVMAVHVHHGELRACHRVLVHHQRRARRVLVDRQRRPGGAPDRAPLRARHQGRRDRNQRDHNQRDETDDEH